MKKIAKRISVFVLATVMLVMSIMPAFAATSSVTMYEDHSVVDCTHYYRSNGNYYFQIKCPKGQLENVSLSLTKDYNGNGGGVSISFKYTSFTALYSKEYAYSDDTSDYYWFGVKCSEYPTAYESSWGGMGIKIRYFNGDTQRMATNTNNYSTTEGRGYWLSA